MLILEHDPLCKPNALKLKKIDHWTPFNDFDRTDPDPAIGCYYLWDTPGGEAIGIGQISKLKFTLDDYWIAPVIGDSVEGTLKKLSLLIGQDLSYVDETDKQPIE